MQVKTELGRPSTIRTVAPLNLVVDEPARMTHGAKPDDPYSETPIGASDSQDPREGSHAACVGGAAFVGDAGECRRGRHRVRAERSSVHRRQSSCETHGDDGIVPQTRGRSDWKAADEALSMLQCIVREDPREPDYLRSRWSSQLLAVELGNMKWCRGPCGGGETVAGEAAISVSTSASDDIPAPPGKSRAARGG